MNSNTRFSSRIYIDSIKLSNYLTITVPFAACWFLYYSSRISSPFNLQGNFIIVALYFAWYTAIAQTYDAAQLSLHRISEMVYSQTIAFLVTDALLYIIICILSNAVVTVVPGLICIAGQFVASCLWCYLFHQLYFWMYPPRKTAVVYDNRQELTRLIDEYGLSKRFDVQKRVKIDDCLKDFSLFDDCDVIFINDVHSSERNKIIKYGILNDKDLYIVPRLGDVMMSGAKNMHMFHLPIQRLYRYNPHLFYRTAKRLFDILISIVSLMILSPAMLLVAAAIKVYDGGPVFYKQTRLTKDGREFQMLKFRSMNVDAERDTGAILSAGDSDPRVTPIGKIIRKVRFDELPQMLNILKGDMAIVGPRPERPEIAEEYAKTLPEFKLRLQIKAGLTGYAQVYGKYNTTPYNKLKMDLMYIAHPSFVEDLRICMETIRILFLPESTEGVDSEHAGIGNSSVVNREVAGRSYSKKKRKDVHG